MQKSAMMLSIKTFSNIKKSHIMKTQLSLVSTLTHKQLFQSSLLVLLFSIISGCTSSKTETAAEQQPEKVGVMILQKQPIDRTIELNTTLLAFQEVYLSPASPGRIEKIYVDVGSRFNAGDLLIEMDQTQLLQAKLQLNTLSRDLSRLDTLLKANAIAQQQYDQLKAQYEITRKNVEFLEKNLRLRAPFSGVVAARFFQEDEMYSGAPAVPGAKAAILHLVQLQPLKAIINVPEQYYPLVHKNLSVELVPDIFPDHIIQAKVAQIYPTIDQLSHTFQIELHVPNPGEKLRPGMFCKAILHLEKTEGLLVPSTAVMKIPGSFQQYVFIARNNTARQILVQTGKRWEDLIEISSDELKTGDSLIIQGNQRLQDGSKIQIVQ